MPFARGENQLMNGYYQSSFDNSVQNPYLASMCKKVQKKLQQDAAISQRQPASNNDEINWMDDNGKDIGNDNEDGSMFLLGETTPADYLVVYKNQRQLVLMNQGKIVKTFRVALGRSPEGKKRQEGDNKTPEGVYHIGYKNSASDYHLSLEIDYPNQDDINWARKKGVSPGGDIMIHGLPNSKLKRAFINHPKKDWTRGCVAVTNSEIEDIWKRVKTGTPIELCP